MASNLVRVFLHSPLKAFRALLWRIVNSGLYEQSAAFLVSIGLWLRAGGRVKFHKGKLIVFYPRFMYDFVALSLYGLNWVINLVPTLQPNSYDWTTDESLTPKRLANGPTALDSGKLQQLGKDVIARKDTCFSEAELMQLFDSLDPAPASMMVGNTWVGHVLRSKCTLDIPAWLLVKPFERLGFRWGKRYCTPYTGDPLLVRWGNLFVTPVPAWGNVAINEIVYRGKLNATMVYDHQPWQDYFRILDNGSESGQLTILGIWTARDKNGGFFTLTLDPDTPTE